MPLVTVAKKGFLRYNVIRKEGDFLAFYKIIFSPTGGTMKAAASVCEGFGGEWENIDLCSRKTDFSKFSFGPEDFVLAAVPSFGGRVPAVAAERLGLLRASGTKAAAIAVFGNRAADDTLLELGDILSGCGFTVCAGIEAVAEHSIIRKYGEGRPDGGDVNILRDFGKQIFEKLGEETAPEFPGNRPFKEFGGLPFKAKVNTTLCKKCGLCAAGCPVGAIPPENPQKTDNSACITCMRCVAICPAGARNLDRLALAGVKVALAKPCAKRKKNVLYI